VNKMTSFGRCCCSGTLLVQTLTASVGVIPLSQIDTFSRSLPLPFAIATHVLAEGVGVLYPEYRRSLITPKNLDMTVFLQR
jgi:hypothetical protein